MEEKDLIAQVLASELPDLEAIRQNCVAPGPSRPSAGARARKTVLAFAAAFILMAATVFGVSALREPVLRFFVETFEKFSRVFYETPEDASLPGTLETSYAPAWLPEGYREDPEQLFDSLSFCMRIYVSDDKYEIIFQQYTIQAIGITIDTEGVTTKQVAVNADEGLFYSNKGIQNVLWNDGQYGYSVSGPVTEAELLRVAQSLQPLQ